MDKVTGLKGFEGYGLELDIPESLRCLADQIESGEIKDFAIVTLDGHACPESMVICRDELMSILMQAVVEEMNCFLCEQVSPERRTTH